MPLMEATKLQLIFILYMVSLQGTTRKEFDLIFLAIKIIKKRKNKQKTERNSDAFR